MISPTNYHIPSSIAEALGHYHLGNRSILSDGLTQDQVPIVDRVAEEITDPSKNLHFGIQHVGQHALLLVDDHDRPPRTIAIDR